MRRCRSSPLCEIPLNVKEDEKITWHNRLKVPSQQLAFRYGSVRLQKIWHSDYVIKLCSKRMFGVIVSHKLLTRLYILMAMAKSSRLFKKLQKSRNSLKVMPFSTISLWTSRSRNSSYLKQTSVHNHFKYKDVRAKLSLHVEIQMSVTKEDFSKVQLGNRSQTLVHLNNCFKAEWRKSRFRFTLGELQELEFQHFRLQTFWMLSKQGQYLRNSNVGSSILYSAISLFHKFAELFVRQLPFAPFPEEMDE